MLRCVVAREPDQTPPPAPPRGAPVWLELRTPDREAATAFYGKLFGWRLEAAAGTTASAAIAALDGLPLGLFEELPHTSAAWRVCFSCAQLEAELELACGHGGQVESAPREIPGIGRGAHLGDPDGAPFGLIEAAPGVGVGLGARRPGLPCWHELDTSRPERALDFYPALFGYRASATEAPSGAAYSVLSLDGVPAVGVLAIEDTWPETIPPRWLAFFAVEDIERAAARVSELGGRISLGPLDSPNGPLAIVRDPQGAAFCLVVPVGVPGEAT